jgi:hypothetical protein
MFVHVTVHLSISSHSISFHSISSHSRYTISLPPPLPSPLQVRGCACDRAISVDNQYYENYTSFVVSAFV